MGEQMGQSPRCEDQSPSVFMSRRPTGNIRTDSPRAPRRSGDLRIRRRGRAVGLVQEEVTGVLAVGANDHVAQMTWRSDRPGLRVRRRDRDVTRPSLMRISQDRRDPNPARARVFCRRLGRRQLRDLELSSTSKPISSTVDGRLDSGHELFDPVAVLRVRPDPSGRGRVRSCHRGWVGPVPGATFSSMYWRCSRSRHTRQRSRREAR